MRTLTKLIAITAAVTFLPAAHAGASDKHKQHAKTANASKQHKKVAGAPSYANRPEIDEFTEKLSSS